MQSKSLISVSKNTNTSTTCRSGNTSTTIHDDNDDGNDDDEHEHENNGNDTLYKSHHHRRHRRSHTPSTSCEVFQYHENDEALVCIVHQPCIANLWGNLHPVGSLHERPFDLEKAIAEHNIFVQTMKRLGVQVLNVVDVLSQGCHKDNEFDMTARIRLEELAMKNLQYRLHSTLDANTLTENEKFLIGDEYKRKCIEKINTSQLIDVVTTCPTLTLQRSHRDTELEAVEQTMSPAGNLIFTRDQQITTVHGVVFGLMSSPQRQGEVEIMQAVFDKLDIPVIGRIEHPGRLEGGDFIPAGERCFIGTGLRTNSLAVSQLMQRDLLGFHCVVEVQDIFERSQDRMHLDCVFNIVGEHTVLLLDTLMQEHSPTRRLVNEFIRTSDGSYKQSQCSVEFSKYLREQGFKIISIPSKFQLQYGVNCLNLGQGRIIMMHEGAARLVASNAHFEGTISVIDFSNVTSMYGSLHCCSQVVRRRYNSRRKKISSTNPAAEKSLSDCSSSSQSSTLSPKALFFVCEDIALIYRDGLPANMVSRMPNNACVQQLADDAKGRHLQLVIQAEMSALHLLVSDMISDIVVITREHSLCSNNSIDKITSSRMPMMLTPVKDASTIVLYTANNNQYLTKSLKAIMREWFVSFLECDIDTLDADDIVIDYVHKVMIVSSVFIAERQSLDTLCAKLTYSLSFVEMHSDMIMSHHLRDVLTIGSRLIVVCNDAFTTQSLSLIQTMTGADRRLLSVTRQQSYQYACSIVHIQRKHTSHIGVLLSQGVLDVLDDEQQCVLRAATDFISVCELPLCESLGIGSVASFVCPTYT